MKAVILAGGKGTRLIPLTKVIPKPLLPVGKRPVLEIQLIRLKDCGFFEVFLALGYKSELFEAYFKDGRKFGIEIHYSCEKRPLGTAGPLRLIASQFNTPFLVMNGDILTDMDFRELWRYHRRKKADLTLVTKKLILPLRYGSVRHKNNRVIDIIEKPSLFAEISAGIYVMNPEILTLIPENAYYSMDVLIKQLIKLKYAIYKYELKEFWLDIGQMDDYNRAQEIFNEGTNKD